MRVRVSLRFVKKQLKIVVFSRNIGDTWRIVRCSQSGRQREHWKKTRPET